MNQISERWEGKADSGSQSSRCYECHITITGRRVEK